MGYHLLSVLAVCLDHHRWAKQVALQTQHQQVLRTIIKNEHDPLHYQSTPLPWIGIVGSFDFGS